MTILKRARRLAETGRLWFVPPPGPVAWGRLYNCGVLVALNPGAEADAVALTLARGGERERDLPVERRFVENGTTYLHAALDPALLAAPATLRLTVVEPGRADQQRIAVGPGRDTLHLDGIVAGAVEGWVSSLSSDPLPALHLVVDGLEGEAVLPAIYRPELRFGSREGGWNGFRLTLPAWALDGQPHLLAVRAGDTLVKLGPYAPRLRASLHVEAPSRVTGWVFDAAGPDRPSLVRAVRDGEPVAEVETHPRPDLLERFGRHSAAFAFPPGALPPGTDLAVGPVGAGPVLGHLRGRIELAQAEARTLLLRNDPSATLAERRALRDRLVAAIRPGGGARLVLAEPAAPEPVPESGRTPPPACAIVPVYDGLADLERCLASLLPQLAPGRMRALVIDDASPDPGVTRALDALAAEGRPGLTVLRNEANLGFIGTVNAGLALLEPGEDAVLVNADTVLAPRALEKLARACHRRPGIASATPLSNNATILGFPGMPEAQGPLRGFTPAAIDAAFEAAAPQPVTIPTGVGFCLHLNRQALDEVGGLSPEWGRGYCEEVDWCLKARDLGWIHVAATDTYVEHEGSVSFGKAERLAILAQNHDRLVARYPDYQDEVDAFIAADPLEPVRVGALGALLAQSVRRLTLHLGHGLGGGATRYVDQVRGLNRAPDHEIAALAPAGRRLSLTLDTAGAALSLRPGSLLALLEALERQGVAIDLHLNARFGYPTALLDRLLSGRWPYAVTLHDFQWYCPKVHLVDGRDVYCEEPPPEVCRHCTVRGVTHDYADQNALMGGGLDAWLATNERILRGARRLVAPSRDTAERYAHRLGLTGIAVVPHPEAAPAATPARPRRARTGAVRVALVGSIGHHKGFELVVALAERAARERRPIAFTVIGSVADPRRAAGLANLTVTGAYDPADLPRLLAEADPDYVFLSSVWPETYSYVLSEAWSAGYPVVAFDTGAPAERIRAEGGGLLLPLSRDTSMLLDALVEARNRLAEVRIPALPAAAPSLAAYEAAIEAGKGAEGSGL
ncbi:glycosyltransferase [Methylobacterium nonmethylotrophicum]|uniref:Glycosyltransferase n=1 Tax=Methylobacterium nonmethylotrophicum TaxID=1141884 RepID=A0A4Z0NWN0_9HYPH|nr:glycosyltransferase [Methylobacterium nonmethylotrophicum]TGE02280.1 glycosyltransferase [Methylobacterium nonmethylotrophicum]